MRYSKMDKFYTPEEIAQLMSCSKDKVYKMIESNAIPFIRFGNSVRIFKPTFENWLLSQKSNQVSEVKAKWKM
jgi:excisionase family DNA binding protein